MGTSAIVITTARARLGDDGDDAPMRSTVGATSSVAWWDRPRSTGDLTTVAVIHRAGCHSVTPGGAITTTARVTGGPFDVSVTVDVPRSLAAMAMADRSGGWLTATSVSALRL